MVPDEKLQRPRLTATVRSSVCFVCLHKCAALRTFAKIKHTSTKYLGVRVRDFCSGHRDRLHRKASNGRVGASPTLHLLFDYSYYLGIQYSLVN